MLVSIFCSPLALAFLAIMAVFAIQKKPSPGRLFWGAIASIFVAGLISVPDPFYWGPRSVQKPASSQTPVSQLTTDQQQFAEADQADASSPEPPEWQRLQVGNRAYLRATIREDPEKSQLVCPTKTAFTDMMTNQPQHCNYEPVGSLVVIHKLRQDPGIFGGDAIYVIAKHWSGLVEDDKLVPLVPAGTIIQCGGAADDETDRTLYNGNYQEKVDLGVGAFRAEVTHTLEPTETLGPAVRILSGRGKGQNGYLLFSQELDSGKCVLIGTKFGVEFDIYRYENQ